MKDFGSRLDKGLAEEIAQITRAESKPTAAPSVHMEAATGGIVINGTGNTITVAAVPQYSAPDAQGAPLPTEVPSPRRAAGTPAYRVGLIIAAALAWGLVIGLYAADARWPASLF